MVKEPVRRTHKGEGETETNIRTRAVLSLGYDKLFTMWEAPGMKADQIKKIICQLKLPCLKFIYRFGGDKKNVL